MITKTLDVNVNRSLLAFSSVSDPDPYHFAGSGSTSGNVDPDLGSQKIVINAHKNEPKL